MPQIEDVKVVAKKVTLTARVLEKASSVVRHVAEHSPQRAAKPRVASDQCPAVLRIINVVAMGGGEHTAACRRSSALQRVSTTRSVWKRARRRHGIVRELARQ